MLTYLYFFGLITSHFSLFFLLVLNWVREAICHFLTVNALIACDTEGCDNQNELDIPSNSVLVLGELGLLGPTDPTEDDYVQDASVEDGQQNLDQICPYPPRLANLIVFKDAQYAPHIEYS